MPGADNLFPLSQVAEKLAAFAQPTNKHLAVRSHLSQEPKNRLLPEVEAAIHTLDRILDLVRRQMTVPEGGYLQAITGDEGVAVEPPVFRCLPVKLGARIGRGNRNLNGEGID